MTVIRVLSLRARSTFLALNRVARLSVCALCAIALLTPAAHAATGGNQRVTVKYASKYVHITPSRKPLRTGTDSAKSTFEGIPAFESNSVLVVDFSDGQTLYAKNPQSVAPIASITKLMTAMVVLDAGLPLDEELNIEIADFDFLKFTHSRLGMGSRLARRELLRLALMSSENRAAAALGRAYPGGRQAFTAAMNRKAGELGMSNTRFVDSTGLSSDNVSSAQDLVKMVHAAYRYPLIREFTTTSAHEVENLAGHHLQFGNTNALVKNPAWKIGLSKTGYIRQAGRCLVMQARIAARPVIIVLLDSSGKQTRLADANRIKTWLEGSASRTPRVS